MTTKDLTKKDEISHEKVPSVCSKRWILAYIGCLGFFAIYSMRVNLSVAIICMVRDDNKTSSSNSSINTTDSSSSKEQCVDESSSSHKDNEGEFDWDKDTQAMILSSFFYGYLGTNVLGGWLSGIFGGRRVWGTGVLIAAITTVLVPVSARFDYRLVIALRVICGLAQGVSFPSMHTMLGKWAPLAERTKLASFTYAGQNIGNIVTYMISGELCANGFDGGWPSIFYVTGGMCFIWVAAWFFLVADSPEQHPTISEAERNHILKGRGNISHRDVIVPWWSMAKSRALWVCLAAHVGNNWLNYTLLTGLPSFMKEVLKFDVKQNGLLSAVPYIVMTFTMIGSGYLADYIRSKWLNTTYTRRLFQAIAFIGAGACIVAVGFVDCVHRTAAVVLLAVAVGFEGLCFAGYMVNQVDFAPRYAGVLMGITNMIATVPGIVAPLVIGALTPNKTQEEWKNVFYICGAFCLFGTLTFGGFASGTLEPWAVMPTEIVVTPDTAEKDKQDYPSAHVNSAFYNSDETLHKKDDKTTDGFFTKL